MPHDAVESGALRSEGAPRRLPVWALGLANTPTGFVFGFISTAMGILLAARHVPVARVGEISAIAFSPCFWAWTLSPVLDVRFTKRAYGYFFATLAALLLGTALFVIGNLTLFTIALTASCASVVLYSTAVGGLMPDILANSEYDVASGWVNVANLGAAGIFGAAAVGLVRTLPLPAVAVLLVLAVMAPVLLLLPRFPAAPRPEGSLAANFAAMARDLRRVAREGRIWIGLLIFLVPVGGFALTNLFSTLGSDFGAGEKSVTLLNGPGVAVACSVGCLLAIPLCRRWKRRTVYLAAGVGAALVSGAMGFLPHTMAVYLAGVLAYNLCQGFNYTAMIALEFDIVGPRNALAGTMIAVMTASANVPISTMTYIDSRAHDAHGLHAMFMVDSLSALGTIVVLMLVLPLLDRWLARRT
jgi:PAT family beta-lactamase induction signal transducer AmpG